MPNLLIEKHCSISFQLQSKKPISHNQLAQHMEYILGNTTCLYEKQLVTFVRSNVKMADFRIEWGTLRKERVRCIHACHIEGQS